jgi:hypothetical protein
MLQLVQASDARPPKSQVITPVAALTCDFLWKHDFFSLSRRLQLANAGLPPGDKLKHVPRRSHRWFN